MMKLRHQYNSASPYESCGYERIPAYPAVGERVTVLCRAEPYEPKAVLRLHWLTDETEQPSIYGKLRHIDGEGRGCYEFSLPPLPDCTVKYCLEAVGISAPTQSEWFDIEPLRPAMQPEFIGAWRWKEGFGFALCAGGQSLFWQWTATDGHIEGLLSAAGQVPEGAVPLQDGESFAPLPDIQAVFQQKPFVLALSGQGGELLRLCGEDILPKLTRDGQLWELQIKLHLAANAVFGMGERFNRVDQLGKNVCISSYEKFTDQGERSYLPIPFFWTDRGIGWLHGGGFESRYSFRPEGDGCADVLLVFSCKGECRDTLLFGNPAGLLQSYGRLTGEAILPPRWSFGPWMSSNRWERQEQAEEQLSAMEKYRIPATVFVLERWSDDTTFDCFEDVPHPLICGDKQAYQMEDFRFSESKRWPEPFRLTEKIHALGMKLILWQAPILRCPEDAGEQSRADYAYAISKKYCVMQPDGTPFTCPEGWFLGSLLIDFTNPKAVRWWNQRRKWLLSQLHADGFKTDSGELVTDDRSVFANGKNGREMRNLYPMAYEEAYAGLLREQGTDGVNFTRAGYTGAQKYPIHWTGDQRSSFAELRAQVRAALSAGLSGVLFMGTDLSGFAGEPPTGELFRRGVCLAAFSGMMQFHSEPTEGGNNDRSPWNMARLCNDPELISHYRRYANLRMSLLPYLYSEAIFGTKQFRPLMAHLTLDFPADEIARQTEDAYLLGRSLLVAPVLDSGSGGRMVYFPAGEWVELSTGKLQPAGTRYISCEQDEIPVYLRQGAVLPLALQEGMAFGGAEDTFGEQLCFLCTGDGQADFWQASDSCLTFSRAGDTLDVDGACPEKLRLLFLTGDPPRSVRINGVTSHIRPDSGTCWGRQLLGIQAELLR